jgi:hypothetical protein
MGADGSTSTDVLLSAFLIYLYNIGRNSPPLPSPTTCWWQWQDNRTTCLTDKNPSLPTKTSNLYDFIANKKTNPRFNYIIH